MDYFKFAKSHVYLLATALFAAVAVVCFMSGHPFTGILSVAGAALAGSILLKDNLPTNKGDEDDLTSI